MTIATVPRVASGRFDLQDELQADLAHVRDLVFVRNLLRERGATSAELRESDAVIDEWRKRLAESAKRASARYTIAA